MTNQPTRDDCVEGEVIENKQEQKQGNEEKALITKSEVIPSFPTKPQIQEYENFLKNYDEFIEKQLKREVDFGVIPGVDRPTLYKPGAEKLEKLHFFSHEKIMVEKIVSDTFIKYSYRTIIYDKNGKTKATCEGTCNSKEKKYRYITVFDNQATPDQKKDGQRIEKRSKAGKPYFVYQIEKDDYYDLENTIMKMAQKRSYVGAILEATNSSGRFTQDVEDMDLGNNVGNIKQYPKQSYSQKYKPQYRQNTTPPTPTSQVTKEVCDRCKKEITKSEADYSKKEYQFKLCRECQQAAQQYKEKQEIQNVKVENAGNMPSLDQDGSIKTWQIEQIRKLAKEKLPDDSDQTISDFLGMFGFDCGGDLKKLSYKKGLSAVKVLTAYGTEKEASV